ncbi:MAG: putative structural protein [Prokaryotic dsDNA virus sp.]|nr:hypothetical protein [Phycisphaerae bacterium]QDP45980.1 MAG: putative structural protein [Prokaryotic dsDNA virus sp.]|tara:strand:+ start:1252 stop:1668 length:417 start_codon:yes stop_codon:yes gene_type:complete
MSVNSGKFSFSWNTVAARGFADGDAVSAEFDNDSTSSYSGTKGEGTTVTSVDGRATITVRLQGDSKTYADYVEIDKSMKLGEISDVQYIYKKVMGANTTVWSGTCALSKLPSLTANREMPEIELVFKSSDSEMVVNRV